MEADKMFTAWAGFKPFILKRRPQERTRHAKYRVHLPVFIACARAAQTERAEVFQVVNDGEGADGCSITWRQAGGICHRRSQS